MHWQSMFAIGKDVVQFLKAFASHVPKTLTLKSDGFSIRGGCAAVPFLTVPSVYG